MGVGGEVVGPGVSSPNTGGGGGSGTVTSVSVSSANGLAGTVANATTTPAITLTTTVTGILKGNGTAISAAVAGTDYLTPSGNGSSLTGITQSQVSGSQAGPLTGDVTTSGAAATLVGTANVIAVVTAILVTLGIAFGNGNPNTNTGGSSQAGTLNEVYVNLTASGNNDWIWRCSTGGVAGVAVWVGKL